VLIKFEDSTAQTHDTELATANEVLQKAKAGEDFYSLVEQYGEDPGMKNNPDGYYFTSDNSLEKAFYDASIALDVNGISDIVQTSYGYHVIKRLPVEEKYFRENSSTFASDDISSKFKDLIDTKTKELKISYTGAYDKIDFKTFASDDTATSSDSK
jgi:parvulin-like peptidyl-prolyl isomerase